MILNLKYYLARPGDIAWNDLSEWLEVAHDRIEEAFEACITDQLRQQFEEVIK